MIKRKIRGRNLRRRMFSRCALLVLIMALAMVGLFALARQDSAMLRRMLDYKTLYNEYFSNVAGLREMLLRYVNTAQEEDRESCFALASQCVEQATALAEHYAHPQFEDQRQMALSLRRATEEFLSREDLAETLEAYRSAARAAELICASEARLTEIEKRRIEEEMRAFDRMRWIRLSVLGMVTLSTLGLGLLFSRRIAEEMVLPLERLTEQVRRAGQETLSFIMPAQTLQQGCADEISMLSRAFYGMVYTIQNQMRAQNEQTEMVRKIKDLEVQNMRMKVLLAQSELRVTQSLINPHFLFNCLNTISSLEYLEGATQSREATQRIAVFLRDALSRVGKVVSIREEIDRLERYIEIQKLRFGERISYAIEAALECLDAKIPAMALQPLMENAIVHGVGGYVHGGTVRVEIALRGERVRIRFRIMAVECRPNR